jgi:hypothetical protein
MSDVSTASRGDLISLIYDLIEQNNGLKDQVSKLTIQIIRLRKQLKKQKSSKDNSPSSLPSFVKSNVKRRKKKTAKKKRALNFARKKEKPDKYVFHSHEKCPDCGGLLGTPSVAFTRQVVDIPLPKVEITEHVIFKRWCTNCKTRTYPKVDLSSAAIGKQRLGLNLTSMISTLSEEFRQPINKIKSFLKMTYELEISEGEIVRLLNTASTKGRKKYNEIKKNLRKSNVVYADETGSREAGINGYQWSFSNSKYQLIWYHKRRNSETVREFTGEDGKEGSFEGVLVTDFLASYNTYNGFHQRCWVHFLRDIKKTPAFKYLDQKGKTNLQGGKGLAGTKSKPSAWFGYSRKSKQRRIFQTKPKRSV